MSLDLSKIGRTYTSQPFHYSWRECVTYALGIGAGPKDLSYTWEGAKNFKVYPSFVVIPTQPLIMEALKDMKANFKTLVHGAQSITLHKSLSPQGVLYSKAVIDRVFDKGKGSLIILKTYTEDQEKQLVSETSWSIFCRGQGGFGGQRGKKTVLPETKGSAIIDKEIAIPPHQALLYRLNGDRNPLHVDPQMAKTVGFKGPILHGLCTYGYAIRVIVEELCEPSALLSFAARFSREVYPGDTVNVQIFATNTPKTYRLQVQVAQKQVLSQGLITIR